MKVKDVIQAVTDILGYSIAIDDRGARAGDVPANYASSERLRKATKWRPRVGLDEGLRRTIEYYRVRLPE